MKIRDLKDVLNFTVFVAGLGYFVDLFDITLFGVVRVSSLKAIGIESAPEILSQGLKIYNAQMIGMMVGGLLWGLLADKKGRLSVMFGSILLYSISNVANAFIWDVDGYLICRFLGGVGLAGELGAAVTLVAESLPKEKRGVGTTVVATLGMFGIVAAALVGQLMTWKVAYLVGGALGGILLVMRLKVFESSMFEKAKQADVEWGSLKTLLRPKQFTKYLACIIVGIPVYFTTGILFTFAPELTSGLDVQGPVIAGMAILYGSIGLTLGDLLSGILSQYLRSRKKAVAICLSWAVIIMVIYTMSHGLTNDVIYLLCGLIGVGVGYWAVLVTMAAEQFGTNIRGTVATTVPNFVRGSAIFATCAFAALKTNVSVSIAALSVGLICFGLAFLALWYLSETFGKDLNYFED